MTSSELEKVIAKVDEDFSPNNEPLDPKLPLNVAQFRATLEVAYQLAFLNERIDKWEGRNSPLRVRVESGDWPLQVTEVKAL